MQVNLPARVLQLQTLAEGLFLSHFIAFTM